MESILVPDLPVMLRPFEVAALFGVDTKTVWKWSRDGQIECVVTPGGHRRYPRDQVLALMRRTAAAAAGPMGDEPCG